MTNAKLKDTIKNFPKRSGIYIFKGLNNKFLYIGKASNLKSRINSYLKTEDTRIKKMLESARSLKFLHTESDIEALILESLLIKKLRPQFNIVMRDDKQYFYVGFTKTEFPRIFWTHQPHNSKFNGSTFIGPFTDGNTLKSTLRFLRRIFPYCTCTKPHNNFCLNYHIGKCLGYCCLKKLTTNNRQLTTYRKNINAIKYILGGKKKSLIRKLENEMDWLAKNDNLEGAIVLRNKISDLKRIFENARIIKNSDILKVHRSGLESLLKLQKPITRIEGYDISNIQGAHATGSMVTFIQGRPDKNFYRKFKIYTKQTPDDTAMLKEILERRFKHDEWPFPDLILIDGGRGQVKVARTSLAALNISIPIVGISKNERHLGHQLVILGRKSPLPLTKISVTDKNLLLAINSEAHRFAIGYYRKLHRKLLK